MKMHFRIPGTQYALCGARNLKRHVRTTGDRTAVTCPDCEIKLSLRGTETSVPTVSLEAELTTIERLGYDKDQMSPMEEMAVMGCCGGVHYGC